VALKTGASPEDGVAAIFKNATSSRTVIRQLSRAAFAPNRAQHAAACGLQMIACIAAVN
jgi:hypothetical protein